MVQKEIVGRFHNDWLACSAPGHLYKNLHKNLIPHLRALWWYVHVCIPPNYFPFSHSFSLSIIFSLYSSALSICLSIHTSLYHYLPSSFSSLYLSLSLLQWRYYFIWHILLLDYYYYYMYVVTVFWYPLW